MKVEARGRVPESDDESFRRAATAAEEGCSISALVRASASVSVDAQFE